MSVMISTPVHVDSALSDWRHGGFAWPRRVVKPQRRIAVRRRRGAWRRRRGPSDHLMLPRWASSSDTVREIKYLQLILPAPWRTHPGLLDARPEFEPGILALLQCSALRRPALPGLQSREHDPERLQGPRCEMQHKRQRHFAFVFRCWLTWFYPQVCPNQALSGRQSFVLPASCRAPASANHPPE